MYKVLLVDDEILVRKAVGKKLEWNQLGFELVGDCENGKDAIEFIKEHLWRSCLQISVCRRVVGRD